MARRTKPTIDDELIDKLLEGREHSAALLDNDGLIGELKKRLAERMLSAEMDVHLDADDQQAAGNHRNGYSQKSVTMADDRVVLDIPRDRNGQFDPLLIPKYARRFPGFDDKIIALYARGMSTRDIQAHVEEIYGPTLVGRQEVRVVVAVLVDLDLALGEGAQDLVARQAVVGELDEVLVAQDQGHHHVREDDRVADRQDRELGRDLDRVVRVDGFRRWSGCHCRSSRRRRRRSC